MILALLLAGSAAAGWSHRTGEVSPAVAVWERAGAVAQEWIGQEGAARSARRASDAVRSVISARGLSRQNDRLAAQTDLLRRQNALLRQSDIAPVPLLGLETEAARLQELTSTATRALVIGRGADQWADALILNMGSGSGVRSGDVVISGPDLIGVIARVYWGTCVVRLVTDRYTRLPARCARSQESLGMACGTARGLLQLRDLPLSSDLREGDLVCTAGLGTSVPGGLLLGRVETYHQIAVLDPATGTRRPRARATVRPVSDPLSLDSVWVIRLGEGGD